MLRNIFVAVCLFSIGFMACKALGDMVEDAASAPRAIAGYACNKAVEASAQHAFRWTERPYWPQEQGKPLPDGTGWRFIMAGNSIEMANAFGVYYPHRYRCSGYVDGDGRVHELTIDVRQ